MKKTSMRKKKTADSADLIDKTGQSCTGPHLLFLDATAKHQFQSCIHRSSVGLGFNCWGDSKCALIYLLGYSCAFCRKQSHVYFHPKRGSPSAASWDHYPIWRYNIDRSEYHALHYDRLDIWILTISPPAAPAPSYPFALPAHTK